MSAGHASAPADPAGFEPAGPGRLGPPLAAALVGLATALVAAGAALGSVPFSWGAPAALWTLCLGLGQPVLARWSPVESSWLKLLTFSSLVSPVLATGIYLALRLRLDPQAAVGGTLLTAAALQLLLLGKRVRCERPGRATWCALGLAALCALAVALVLFDGNAARISYHGLEHSSILLAVDRSVPPENPWLAGTELSYYWVYHAAGALFARALNVAPTWAFAWINLWAALLQPLALYFLAAPLWREGRRELAGVVLAVFGLNILGGWHWLVGGAPWRAPVDSMELFRELWRLIPPMGEGGELAFDTRLAVGFSKFFNVSSHPISLTLWCGGLAAAAHALRHGKRPWVGLCGLLHGASFAFNPLLGGIGIAGTAAAAAVFAEPMRAGRKVLTSLAIWSLPGAWTVLAARTGHGEALVVLGFDARRALAPLLPLAFLLVPALLALVPAWRSAGGDEERRRSDRVLLGLLVASVLVPLVAHALVRLPLENQYKFVRAAAVPLGILAGGGLFCLGRRPLGRVLGALLMLALGVGLVANNTLGMRGYLAVAGTDLPLREEPMALCGTVDPTAREFDPLAADLSRLWPFLRHEVAEPFPEAILILNTLVVGRVYGSVETGDLFRFADERNLQGCEAAAFAGLSIWCDRSSYQVERSPEWMPRLEALAILYAEKETSSSGSLQAIQALDRPLLALVTEEDRRLHERRGDLDNKFRLLGFRDVLDEGSVSLYAWPADFAAELAAAAMVPPR